MMQMISNEFVCRVDEAFNFLGDLWHDERIKKSMVYIYYGWPKYKGSEFCNNSYIQ